MQVHVLHVRGYSFTGQRDGRQVVGAEITYLPAAREDRNDGNGNFELGTKPATAKAPGGAVKPSDFGTVPALCEIEVEARADRAGNSYAVITSARRVDASGASSSAAARPIATANGAAVAATAGR